MSDFLRTLAAANSTTAGNRFLASKERLRRHLKALPAYIIHSWKSSSAGFKSCTALSSLLLLIMIILQVRQERTSLPSRETQAYVHPLLSPGRDFAPRRTEACTVDLPCTVQLVADLDTRSKIGSERAPLFMSKLYGGSLILENLNLTWFPDQPFEIVGKLSEEGRGMELSELVLFGESLLSFDDRSGIMYELIGSSEGGNLRGGSETRASLRAIFTEAAGGDVTRLRGLKILPIARAVLPEGDGATSPKGMKIEWATEKDGQLFVGSFGKEFTTPDGKNITGYSNLWVVTVADPEAGTGVTRLDWTSNYQKLREKTGTSFPGYLIHEAVNWSPIKRKWFFLPRRMSMEPYDEQLDEKRGSETIISATEDFDTIETVRVKFPEHDPSRGFSSFKFVPGTNDDVIIAIRSSESEANGAQATYLSVFNIHGDMLTPKELLISSEYKYEGIEIW